jgi:hypothetical protein
MRIDLVPAAQELVLVVELAAQARDPAAGAAIRRFSTKPASC